MNRIINLALLEPSGTETEAIQALFARQEYRLHPQATLADLLAAPAREDCPWEIIVVPLHLADGGSGIRACLQIKSHPALTQIPIIGLCSNHDKAIVQSFYEMGADFVVLSPFDPDLLRFQTAALQRQSRAQRERVEEMVSRTSLGQSALSILDLSREPLAIFDLQGQPLHLNDAALTTLGLIRGDEFPLPAAMQSNLEMLLERHQSRTRGKSGIGTEGALTSFPDQLVTRADGKPLKLAIEFFTVNSSGGQIAGYAARFSETAQYEELNISLRQSSRTRSLCLMTSAICIKLIEAAFPDKRGSILLATREFVDGLPLSCTLSALLTGLLEFLDLAISPSISIRVNSSSDQQLAMRSTDLIQILGHMILHAVEFTGSAGEIQIETGQPAPGEGVPVVISALSRRATAALHDQRLSDLLDINLADPKDQPEADGKIARGLMAAQGIAEKYRTTIEYKLSGETLMKLRIKLPPLRILSTGKAGR